MHLHFEAQHRIPTAAVVKPSGRLDLMVAADLKARIEALVADGFHQLVIDLDEVPFIDSSGLGALIGGLKAARGAGGDVRIARAHEQIRYVLRVSTLDGILTPYATVEDALAGYR